MIDFVAMVFGTMLITAVILIVVYLTMFFIVIRFLPHAMPIIKLMSQPVVCSIIYAFVFTFVLLRWGVEIPKWLGLA